MKRIIGYTRVSSSSPEQLHALEQHKARLKAAGCTEIYWDIASRSKHDRKGLNNVLGQIERGECHEAIFIRVDRMTDSPMVLERAIIICLNSGIPIKGLDDAIDFTTVGGRLHARILCNLARAEVERLSERVKHGHQHHRDRNAAYFPVFGYVKVGDGLQLDTAPFLCLLDGEQEMSKAAIGRDLITIFLECRSLRRSLRSFNEKYGIKTHVNPGKGNKQPRGKLHFGASGFVSWLNNPILRGHTAYGRSHQQRQKHKQGWDIRYETHPEHRLLMDEEYRQIEEILDWNSQRGGYGFKAETVHPLSGLVYCGECRGDTVCISYRLRTNPKQKFYSYQCNNYRRTRSCTQKPAVREDAIEPLLIDALLARSEAIATLAAVPDQLTETPELQALRAELQYYQAAPGARAGAIVAELQNQIEALKTQQSSTTHQHTANRELLVQCFSDRATWEHLMSAEEKRDVYKALVEKVVIKDGQVQSVSLKV
ncbi:MAG: fdxN element excision recombinase XisF [Leptolyngbyaceae cyanobacterium bins.302]|nr:fdxN element excision recombinase XisF [Leptolyngbyaceae cyanobacterium bins.302]